MKHWDVIVLGLGGVGSAAIRHLASRGIRVLGIEQYTPAHQHGSSHGKTRIIRQAYFEHPAYVPLLDRAYDLWDQLERETGQSLFVRCGLVELGPPDGVVIPGVLRSARQYDLPIETLATSDVTRRWPGITGDSQWQAIVETNAGFLRVEDCVRAHLEMARRDGAQCRFGVAATQWRAYRNDVEVTTNEGSFRAKKLVVTGGPWSKQILGSLNIPLQVLRKHQYWIRPATNGFTLNDDFPCFFHETGDGFFYGFPAIDELGVKVARHSGGKPIPNPDASPGDVAIDHEDETLIKKYAENYLPGLGQAITSQAGCYYTSTPDEHFVIDHHPLHSNVTIIAGLSGHGFKFTSALGEVAGNLALDDPHTTDLSLFRLKRFEDRSNQD